MKNYFSEKEGEMFMVPDKMAINSTYGTMGHRDKTFDLGTQRMVLGKSVVYIYDGMCVSEKNNIRKIC
jgi:hypothetical protein